MEGRSRTAGCWSSTTITPIRGPPRPSRRRRPSCDARHRGPDASPAPRASPPTCRCRAMLEAAVLRRPHANARVELDLEAARAVPGVLAVLGPGDAPAAGRGRRADGATPSTPARPSPRSRRSTTPPRPSGPRGARAASTTPLGFVVDLDRGARRSSASRRSRPRTSAATSRPASARPTSVSRGRVPHARPAAPARSSRTAPSPTGAQDELTSGSRPRASSAPAASSRLQFGPRSASACTSSASSWAGASAPSWARRRGSCSPPSSPAARGRPVRLSQRRRDETDRHRLPRARSLQTYRIGARRDGTLPRSRRPRSPMGLGGDCWAVPVVSPAANRSTAARTCARWRSRCASTSGLDRLPRARRDGGLVRLRAGARRARRGARARSARAAAPQPCRPSTGDRPAVQLQAPRGCVRPRRRARRLGRPRRSSRRAGCRRPPARARAACQIWWGGGGPPAHALVRIGADGMATVVTVGLQDLGTGTTTASRDPPPRARAARSTASGLAATRRATASTRPVSGGSHDAAVVAPAVRSAANDVRGQLLDLAADLFEISAVDLA